MSANISAQDVNKLRKMTGVGMMDCKKALVEANGDFDAAIDILRKKGEKVSAKRADRETTEGVVVALTSEDNTKGVVVQLSCETDFVAKNDEFVGFATKIAEAALANGAADAEAVKALTIDGRPVADLITDMVGKIGEKIEISQYVAMEGAGVVSYIHGNRKIGVLVAMNKPANGAVEEAGRDVAMQIAALSPVALDKDFVDEDTIRREMEIGMEQARSEGKPEAMLEKIATGKLNKFFKENTLLNQDFVKDGSMSVAKMLDNTESGLTVTDFKRVAI